MLRDISCIKKNLDLRLELCAKRSPSIVLTVSSLCLIADAPAYGLDQKLASEIFSFKNIW